MMGTKIEEKVNNLMIEIIKSGKLDLLARRPLVTEADRSNCGWNCDSGCKENCVAGCSCPSEMGDLVSQPPLSVSTRKRKVT
ncbi:MAG: hypothetical protein GWN61_02455, partial [candidate division Zixibacteria bacterium]|nr:hypothetical protein [Phycisphaerae bacterium]NIR67985.1 hypothetical protein [candidate division Zixibacteria bacterium]NIU17298.1 hypothetical protein [candidate division Zixibacteria bacterium]NIV05072.1 hypothetical protein [candidate division Zixibacteria bacterium]NIX00218.1 hypothetical protein [Phycisphaerae bacterium]